MKEYFKITFTKPENLTGYMVITDGAYDGLVDEENTPIVLDVVEYKLDGTQFVIPNFAE